MRKWTLLRHSEWRFREHICREEVTSVTVGETKHADRHAELLNLCRVTTIILLISEIERVKKSNHMLCNVCPPNQQGAVYHKKIVRNKEWARGPSYVPRLTSLRCGVSIITMFP